MARRTKNEDVSPATLAWEAKGREAYERGHFLASEVMGFYSALRRSPLFTDAEAREFVEAALRGGWFSRERIMLGSSYHRDAEGGVE